MKKIMVSFIILSLVFCMCACSGNNQSGSAASPSTGSDASDPVENPSSDNSAVSEVSKEASEPTHTESSEFKVCADLVIIAAYVYDAETYVIVENTGDKPILNFSLAYINFDQNGFPTTTDSNGYDSGRATAVNLMPGEKNIFNWYGASGSYAAAAVSSVDYADGSAWSATGINGWVESARSGFDVEAYKQSIVALTSDGEIANNCDGAVLTEVYINHGNQFSDKHDLHFSVQNTSSLGITKLTLFVLEFDENGFPVSVNPYDTCCLNGHRMGGTVNLAAGQTGSYESDLFISATTTQIKTVIANIEFQDGSEWDNPYLYEWLISNCGTY